MIAPRRTVGVLAFALLVVLATVTPTLALGSDGDGPPPPGPGQSGAGSGSGGPPNGDAGRTDTATDGGGESPAGTPSPSTPARPPGNRSAGPASGDSPENRTTGSTPGGPPQDGPPGVGPPGESNTTAGPGRACDAEGGRETGTAAARRPARAGDRGPSLCQENRTAVGNTSLPANASALALRLRAYRQLADANLAGRSENGTEQVRRELQKRLNRTFDAFYDPNRVTDGAVFRADANVTAATVRRAPAVATLLVEVDARLAGQAVADAERVRRQLRRRNLSFDEGAVAAELRKARRATQQAEHVREQSPAPVAAAVHYRRAWRRAQRVLDLLDRNVPPEVTLTRCADPVRTGPANYTVEGRVFAVRPRLLGNVTVTVRNRTFETEPGRGVVRNETPGASVPFAVQVRLPERVVPLVVTAREEDESVTSVVDGEANSSSSSRVTLRLDGDGLPDRYERRVTATDPLDPDSDAGATASNESDDGRIDGRTDFDGDALVTASEREFGTYPLANDTDGDGLDDSYETGVTDTDPTVADTDGDGVDDGHEDPDGDGLTNAREASVGSAPAWADTDGDGLTDAAEVDSGTDPTDPDTDGDGLADGTEVSEPFETDPTVADTDGDGVLDGAESVTTTTVNDPVGAEVSVTGPGASVAGVVVRNGTRSATEEGIVETVSVSTPVTVETDGPVEAGELTLSYDGSRVADESSLVVARVDFERQRLVALPTEIDTEGDTATATVDGFSTFVVVSPSALAGLSSVPSKWSRDFGLDALAGWTCEGSCTAVDGVALVGSPDGDVGIDHVCVRHQRPCIGDPLPTATATPTPTETPTDGPGGGPGPDPTDTAGEGDQSRLTRTVSFDSDVARATVELRLAAGVGEDGEGGVRVEIRHAGGTATVLSGGTGGEFRTIETVVSNPGGSLTVEVVASGDAAVAMDRVRVSPDTDGDGLADPREEVACLPTQLFGCVETDVAIADSDGDGLEDGAEVQAVVTDTLDFGLFGTLEVEYVTLRSRPDVRDTDGDGLEDGTEVDGWEVPVQQSSLASLSVTDEAALDRRPVRFDPSSATTMHLTSDPLVTDTDGDGLSDGTERFATKTDPRSEVTYQTTQTRQRDVVNRFVDLYRAFEANDRVSSRMVLEAAIAYGLLDSDATGEDLLSLNLTDATDDFDLVGVDDGTFGFRALDDRQRTDTWLSNAEELGGESRTDIFDPDTDDDGLTDGQEVKGVTETVAVALSDSEFNTVTLPTKDETITTRTDPTDPDTDGDGVWDGWLGVHGVGHSENVVLYMEHLASGDGLVGDELVPEQAGIHRVSSRAPARTSAIIDGERVHSNIHVGEQHWGTNPNDETDWPDRSLTVEVDYYAGAPNVDALNSERWVANLKRNLALYGLDVTFVRDEMITADSLEGIGPSGTISGRWQSFGLRPEELTIVEYNHKDTGADEYLFVAHDLRHPAEPLGVHLEGTPIMGLATEDITEVAKAERAEAETGRTPFESGVGLVAGYVQLHETGHAYDVGERDDTDVEVPSGSPADATPERLRATNDLWSLMRSGWDRRLLVFPMSGRHYTFSTEELAVIREP